MSDVSSIILSQQRSAKVRAAPLQGVRLRKPEPTDGARLLALVSACPPLDVNSLYCYLLLCMHFSETCIVAERDAEIVGFVSGYREPPRPQVFFCWQIAVASVLRRSGVATAMLNAILTNHANRGVHTIEATVTSPNQTSMRLFEGLAADLGMPCRVEPLFTERHFAPWEHDAEWLVRIGPCAPHNDFVGGRALHDRAPHDGCVTAPPAPLVNVAANERR
jgi:L-2,4-diaminobutyric acid acetyltransferase